MGLKSAKTDEDGQEQGDQEPKKRQASQKQASPPRVLFEDEPRLRAQEYQCQERSKEHHCRRDPERLKPSGDRKIRRLFDLYRKPSTQYERLLKSLKERYQSLVSEEVSASRSSVFKRLFRRRDRR
jgi:hypothetical protein